MRAQAYVNRGQWVADCPDGDGGALKFDTPDPLFRCPTCKVLYTIEWPSNAVWIWDALLARPNPQTRNWAPAGHRQAIATHYPDGQSVADLVAETHANMEASR